MYPTKDQNVTIVMDYSFLLKKSSHAQHTWDESFEPFNTHASLLHHMA